MQEATASVASPHGVSAIQHPTVARGGTPCQLTVASLLTRSVNIPPSGPSTADRTGRSSTVGARVYQRDSWMSTLFFKKFSTTENWVSAVPPRGPSDRLADDAQCSVDQTSAPLPALAYIRSTPEPRRRTVRDARHNRKRQLTTRRLRVKQHRQTLLNRTVYVCIQQHKASGARIADSYSFTEKAPLP